VGWGQGAEIPLFLTSRFLAMRGTSMDIDYYNLIKQCSKKNTKQSKATAKSFQRI